MRLVLETASRIILDKPRELKLALACFLARGHLLIEDAPGMGKTTLVKVLGQLLGLEMKRIQFTSDLLPGDILGVSIYREVQHRFEFFPGPIFANLVLGDELNRATPKTQSACLQALEEGQVTVDGQTHALPEPFFFVGTQNPVDSIGTYPLPESQLDRFLMSISMGFPSREAERRLLMEPPLRRSAETITPIYDLPFWQSLRSYCADIYVRDIVVEYLLDLINTGRSLAAGLSTRTSLAMISAAKAWATLSGRDFVTPQDIQDIALPVLQHRLVPRDPSLDTHGVIARILSTVAVP